ncbi:MAG: DUF4139 domain-containing protein [Rubricoccaceae bacterium]
MLRCLFALAFVASPLLATAQPSDDLPVERVILFTSGVGYFEHGGRVSGDSEVVLRFDESALNDVLKSLLVEDARGRVAGVVYPTQAPVERTLRSFAIDLSGSPDLAGILRQVRGAEVIVTTPSGDMRGTVVSVELAMRDIGDGVGQVPVLSMLTSSGLTTVRLDTARRLRFTDASLQAELEGALTALAEARGGERKPVRVQFRGNGSRPVRLGYVVESPVWKTSYRLVLPEGDSGEGQLQGWALVENPTESDWRNVDLTLVSGRPVSFIQDLYTPRYVQRPVVFAQNDALVRPESYASGLPARGVGAVSDLQGSVVEGDGGLNIRGGRDEEVQFYSPAPPPPARPLDISNSVQAQGDAGDFGELFAYRLGDVTLPRRGSAMLPIVADAVDAERLSIYRQSSGLRHPMRGVRLTNSTDKALRAGPATVLDEGYAGDTQIPDLPAGAERLLTFSLDQDVIVDVVPLPNGSTRITSGSIVDGVLMMQTEQRIAVGYQIENRAEKTRTVLVEHPRRGNGQLVEPSVADETAPGIYRVRAVVRAGVTDTLIVREAVVTDQRIALASTNPDVIAVWARSDGDLPDDVRAALRRAVEQRAELAETERQIRERQREVQEITQEQERIRGNLGAIENDSDYGRRLLDKLNEQETRLETLADQIDRLEAEANRQRAALRVTVR